MPLARIITRSQTFSRELALDLLSRGYAVEVVSPDSVPDNLADLELRVDAEPGDRLIASVEAHRGERTASLEFVHYLKAPMADFIRRLPETGEAVHFPEGPVSFNAEPRGEHVELPSQAPNPAPASAPLAAETLGHPELDPRFETGEGACFVSPLQQLPSLPSKPPSHFAPEASTVVAPITQPPIAQARIAVPTTARPAMARLTMAGSVPQPKRDDRSAGWPWRAALFFASVALFALVLGFGIGRTDRASAQSSGGTAAEKVAAASTDVDLLRAAAPARDPGQVSALAVPPPAIKSEANSGHSAKKSPVAENETAAASPRGRIWHRHGDDLVARDTVTYLDRSFEPRALTQAAPKAKSAKRLARPHPSSRQHGGEVIAADTVTYLDNKPTPKAAKQISASNSPRP